MLRLLMLLVLAAAAMAQMSLNTYSNGAVIRNSRGLVLTYQSASGPALMGFASPWHHLLTTQRNGASVKTVTMPGTSGATTFDLSPGFTDPDPPGTMYSFKTFNGSPLANPTVTMATPPFYIVPVPLTKTVVTNSGNTLTLRIDFNMTRITPSLDDRISINTNAGIVYSNFNVFTSCVCNKRSADGTTPATIGSWTVTLTNPPADIYTIRFRTLVSGAYIEATMPGQIQFDGQKWIVT